jgi:hypothetical protein
MGFEYSTLRMENNEQINQFAGECSKQWEEDTKSIESQLAETKQRQSVTSIDNPFRKCIDQDVADLEAALYFRSMVQ